MKEWGVYKIDTDNGLRIGIEQTEVNGGEIFPLAQTDTQDEAELAMMAISSKLNIPAMDNNFDTFLDYVEDENKTSLICFRCGCLVLKETDPELSKEYLYYCPECDENLYSFETEESQCLRSRTLS